MPGTGISQDLPILVNKIEIKHQLPWEGKQINVVALYLNINYELGNSITRLGQVMLYWFINKELTLMDWHKIFSGEQPWLSSQRP